MAAISEIRDRNAALRFKVAMVIRLRFAIWAAISPAKPTSFCGVSGELAPSTWKWPVIAVLRFCYAKLCRKLPTYLVLGGPTLLAKKNKNVALLPCVAG